ncbi:MAG: helix-turn-helix domain-containing protein [Ferruginibacter sp.]
MQHVEFFDIEHFEKNYYRVKPPASLLHLIDFFWETKFEDLWKLYPNGFSDALFPNIGYTYLINLGTPFIMQVDDKKTKMKTDGFLPRHLSIECHHQPGNIIFGIKFKISPIIFEKKINFSEYKASIYPLSYLLDKKIIENIKQAPGFNQRVELLNEYFESIIKRSGDIAQPIKIVSDILQNCNEENNFTISIQALAKKYQISSRTLQRYFEITTSLSSKKTLQILRVRKAVEHLAKDPGNFDYKIYGYYDYSHFYKHLKQFFQKDTLMLLKPHLSLLSKLHTT